MLIPLIITAETIKDSAINSRQNEARGMEEDLKNKMSIGTSTTDTMKVIAPIAVSPRYSDALDTRKSLKALYAKKRVEKKLIVPAVDKMISINVTLLFFLFFRFQHG